MSTVAPWIGWPPTVSTTRTRKASGTPGRPSVMFLRTMSGSRAYGPAAGCGVSVHAYAGAAAVAGSAVPTADVMPARLSVAAPAAVSAPRRLNNCGPVVSSFSIRYPPYLDKTVKPMLSGTGDVDRPFADIRWSRGAERAPARRRSAPRSRTSCRNGLADEAEHLIRDAQRRGVVHPRYLEKGHAGDPLGGLRVAVHQPRHVQVAEQQRRRHGDLAEPIEHRRTGLVLAVTGDPRPGRRPRLLEYLGCTAGAPPELDDDLGDPVRAVLLRRLQPPEEPRILRHRVSGDARAQQHQRRHPLGPGDGQGDRAVTALAAADHRDPVQPVVVEHGQQVVEQHERLGRRGGAAEPAGVVPDHPVRRGQRRHQPVPEPGGAHAGGQPYHPRPGTPAVGGP